MSKSVDVTRQSPDAVHAVEQFVESLREGPLGTASPGNEADEEVDRWTAAATAVKGLRDSDFDAWAEQQAFNRRAGRCKAVFPG